MNIQQLIYIYGYILTFFLVLCHCKLLIFFKKKYFKLLSRTFIFQSIVYFSAVYYMVPKLEVFGFQKKLIMLLDKNINQVDKVFHYGFNEPSLIFLTSHKAKKKILMNIIN